MDEISWFVIIKGRQQGPYTIAELANLRELTPDTLAWRKGFKDWKPIRRIPELKKIFKDVKPPEDIPEDHQKGKVASDEVLAFPYIEPPWIFWLIFFILLSAYVLFQLFTT